MDASRQSPRLLRAVAAIFLAGVLPLFGAPAAFAECGDGIFDDFEQCDDGNTLDGDCCSANCTLDEFGTPCTDDGNDCTVDRCNGEGSCDHEIRRGLCDDGNDCTTVDFCDDKGECVPEAFAEDFSACSNKDYCGGRGVCFSGNCFGDPADCEGQAGGCHVATCNPDTALCESERLEDGTPCDDNNVCTVDDKCDNGECFGGPRDCSEVADACHDAFCDVEARGCYAVPKENGTPCDDTDACTEQGECDDGECVTSPKDCSGFADECNDAGCDQKSEPGCFADPRPDGTPCDDGDPCTTADQCTAGSCAGTPLDCSELDDPCNTGVCANRIGGCIAVPKEDGTSCDDGNGCTTGDTCTDGFCDGAPRDCSDLTDECNVGFCNGDLGDCQADPRPPGTECDDGSACTTQDECSGGSCTGQPVDCSSAGDDCNNGVCNPQTGQCVAVPITGPASCDDGDPCTTGDACSDGRCAGQPRDCSGEGGSCVEGTCNPESGQCEGTPLGDGTPCNDGLSCTTDDSCTDGVCVGVPVQCPASDTPCRDSRCNPQSGQCELADAGDGTPCDDGEACTTGDQCRGGVCGGTALDCSDLDDACRSGVCNPQSGQCEADAREDGTACDDGAFCTTTDACVGGACVGTGDPCEGGPACASVCDEASDSCLATPGTPCEDDGNPCTEDVCDGGSCGRASEAGTPCQDDGNPCTEDVCDGEGRCGRMLEDGTPCDDGLFCTSDDRCDEGACSGVPTCASSEACSDTCNEAEDVCRRCGRPFSDARCIVNAVFVLQGALGLRECELCTCDVDSSGAVTATDALVLLRGCANLPVVLECPEIDAPATSTTTTTDTTSTTQP